MPWVIYLQLFNTIDIIHPVLARPLISISTTSAAFLVPSHAGFH